MMKNWTSKIKSDSDKFSQTLDSDMTRYPIIEPLVALYTRSLGMNCIEGTQAHLCRKYYATNTNNIIVKRRICFLLESSTFEQTRVANSTILVPAILYQTSPIGMLLVPTIL